MKRIVNHCDRRTSAICPGVEPESPMQGWEELEIEYAKRLRASSRDERRYLYQEAYSQVSQRAMLALPKKIEERTTGTSPALVHWLIRRCHPSDHVLEVGCGRGYTCLKLAPHVRSLVGLDVSDPSLGEARELIRKNGVTNVTLLKGFADELLRWFGEGTFDKVISIDVYEHLHPEDARVHLAEVYGVLKPEGEYIVVTPNRLTGPHDITRRYFRNMKEPQGFHLNETTCNTLIEELKKVGFKKCRTVLPLSFKLAIPIDVSYPCQWYVALEKHHHRNWIFRAILRRLGRILLIAKK